jgi:hypothetical protein
MMILSKVSKTTKEMITVELCKAIKAWLILYSILFLALLGYRYNTRQYYKSKQQQHALAVVENVDSVTAKAPDPVHNILLQKFEDPIQILTEELTTAQNLLQSQLATLDTYLKTLESIQQSAIWQEQPLQQGDEINNDNLTLDHFKKLMTTIDLQYVTSEEELQILFDNGIQEMKILLSNPSTVNWNKVQNTLNDVTHFERQNRDITCPNIPSTEIPLSSAIPNNAVLEQDLQEMLAKFDQLFSERTDGAGIHALLPETRREVEEIAMKMTQEVIQDMTTSIQQFGQRNEAISTSTDCDVDLDMVKALVDAGLKAMAVHGDVREALRKATLEFDSTTELILDADLPPLHKKEDGLASTVIHLRDIIDSPLLIQSMDWIDDFVDLVGGYNEKLDQYLDALANKNSVGEVLVEGLLKRAGRVNVDVQQLGDRLKLPPLLQGKIIEKYG